MDFNIRKPLHLLALFLILTSFLIIIIFPLLSFVGLLPSTQSIDYKNISESVQAFSEFFILLFQLALVILLMIVFPVVWYLLVNNLTVKQAFYRMWVTYENIDKAFLWGILTAVLIFVVFFVINVFIAVFFDVKSEDLSNVQDLEALFSPVSLFLLVATQPIAEELFFRGFLLEKIDSFAGKNIAIILTSVLFGIAHATYGKLYPILLPMIMGIILGYVVFKTKNLLSAVIAHVCFNVGVLILAFIARGLV